MLQNIDINVSTLQDDVSHIKPYAPFPGQPAYTPVVLCKEVLCKARGTCTGGADGKGMMIPTEGLHRGHQCHKCKEFFHNLCTGSEGTNLCNEACTGAKAPPVRPPVPRRQPFRPPAGRQPKPAAANRRQRPSAPRAAHAKLGTCYYHMMSDLEKRSNLMQDPQNFPALKNNFRQLHDISVPAVTLVSQCCSYGMLVYYFSDHF